MARTTSFYYSFLVLPAEQRRAIIAVWDFCRAVDDAVDEPEADGSARGHAEARPEKPSRGIGERSRRGWPAFAKATARPPKLAGYAASGGGGPGASENVGQGGQPARDAVCFWRAELARCYEGAVPETPQGRRLQPFIARFDLPREAFADVIDGVAMDLDTTRYQTFDDLLEYCRRVASAVGLICIRIFECRSPRARDYALNLGIALQLTNIIRDVKDDLARGRVYLPLDDLAAAGCTIDDLAAGRVTPPVRRLMEFECRRGRDFYQRAIDARPQEDRRRLVAAEIMRAVYFETLGRVERRGYDVFSGRTRLPRPRQAAIALREWLWPR